MRVLLLAPLFAACDPANESVADGVPPVDDATPAPPGACEGPSAELFYGDTPSDVIVAGDLLPVDSGANGGAHVSMGLAVSSPTPEVAWRIDLIDVATDELVGSAAAGMDYVFTRLSNWTDESCTGYLPDTRVCLGDCSPSYLYLMCDLNGHTLRAEAYTTTIGGETVGDPQATVEFVLAGGC